MAKAEVSVTIDRPLEDVFAVLTDVEKTATWSAPTVEEHWTTPGPVGVGSRGTPSQGISVGAQRTTPR